MEFRYRAGDQRGRASSSSSMNHYYSSSAPIAYYAQRRFEVGIDNRSLVDGPRNIPREILLEKVRGERIIDERLANEMAQKRMIEEEILARDIARRRMLEEEMLAKEIVRKRKLEEEILKEMEYLNQFPVNYIEEGDYRFDRRLEHGFQESPLNSGSIMYDDDNGEYGGSDEAIRSSRDMPMKSLDMKFPTSKLNGKKRKASSCLPIPAKKGWNCSLCNVIATSRKDLNRHLKGKKHNAKEAQVIKATPSNDSNADFSLEKNCANDKAHEKGEKHQHSNKTGWWCKLCQVKCRSEATLQFHLAGKKHKANFKAQNIKNGEVVSNEEGDYEEEEHDHNEDV